MSEHDLSNQHLYLTSSFRGPGVARLVIPHVEKLLNKTAQEIKVSYIITAGNLKPADQRDWINEGRTIMLEHGWQVFDYDIAGKSETDVKTELDGKDIIFVQGGSCMYMLEQMQKCNFAQIVRRLVSQGVPYIGESVGSMITGPDLSPYKVLLKDRRKNPTELESYAGIGLVNFLFRSHWNNPTKYQNYAENIMNNFKEFFSISSPFILLNDNQLVYVEGDNFQIWEGK